MSEISKICLAYPVRMLDLEVREVLKACCRDHEGTFMREKAAPASEFLRRNVLRIEGVNVERYCVHTVADSTASSFVV